MTIKFKILWNLIFRPGSRFSHLIGEAAREIDQRTVDDEETPNVTNFTGTEKYDLGALCDILPGMIWFKDTEDRLIRVNQQAADALGMSIKEMEGKSFREIYSNDSGKYHADDLEVIQTGKPKLGIVEILRGCGGEEVWVETDKVPFRDNRGKIVGIVVLSQDVTTRKLAENALHDSEEKFRLLTENLAAAFWIRSADFQTIKYMSPGYEKIWGRPLEELTENPGSWIDAVVPEDRDRITAKFKSLTCDSTQITAEYRIMRPDGEIRWIHSLGCQVLNSKGNLVRLTGIATDITLRKQAEIDLQFNDLRLRSLIEATTAIVWDSPASGAFETGQPRWAAYTGQSFEEYKEWGWLKAIHPEDRAETKRIWNTSVANKEIYKTEHRLRSADGSYRDMAVRAIPIASAGGEILEWIGVHTDITERNRAVKRLAANEALLKQFIQHTPAAVAMLDTDMRYIQASDRWIKDYDITDRDVIGLCHYDIFPNIPQRWRDIHARVLSGAVEGSEEDAFPRADGSTEWLQWESRPWHDAAGEIGGLIIYTKDITERKLTEEELRWKTALLEAQVDSYDLGILVVDNTGRKILQNRRMNVLWKIPPEIAESEDDRKQVEFVVSRSVSPEQFHEKILYLYAHPEESSADEIELLDGTILDRYSAPVIGKDGRNYGRIWTFVDITARKRDEAELQR